MKESEPKNSSRLIIILVTVIVIACLFVKRTKESHLGYTKTTFSINNFVIYDHFTRE